MANLTDALQKVAQANGLRTVTVYYQEMIGPSGRKGAKLLRIEGIELSVQQFVENYKAQFLQKTGLEFLGRRGSPIGRVKIIKLVV